MRVPRSPASWGCLGSSAEGRGEGRAGVSARQGVLVSASERRLLGAVPREARSQEQNMAQHVTSEAGWCARHERGLRTGCH